jgi:precorrin-6Y C5,15-methyltransferase (decarboxylating)
MNDAQPFLSILGIGEDGIAGLSPRARDMLANATLVIGGHRHLALADPIIRCERLPWPTPMDDAIPLLLARRPRPVAVLASGDPFCFGAGPMLTRAISDFVCLPAPSSLSLACARLGWALQDAAPISFCGRPIEKLRPLLHPGARILALSADDTTPGAVAAFLCRHGFGASRITVLEALGGPNERIRPSQAHSFALSRIHRLNLLAIEPEAAPGTPLITSAGALPDALFNNDGQLTKREIRAVTLAALAPAPGTLLWDIGSGSGSIAIEWLLRHPANQAIAVERHAERAARALGNAATLGVPNLRMIRAEAPACLGDLPAPDAIFIGGGATHPGMIDTAWAALRPGGRLVINAVTIETQAVLFAAVAGLAGTLTRLGVERMDAVGHLHGFRPAMTVTQLAAIKP